MRKLLLSFALVGSALMSFAQTDAAARKILNDVSKKYSTYQTIQSDFTLSIQDANKKTHTTNGVMYFNKPKNQYAISLPEQEVISDGKSVWNISKDIKEVQISENENNSNTIGPNNLFNFYQKGYKYVLMPDEKIVRQGNTEWAKVIELSPEDTKTNYFKIKLRINKNNHIQDVTIFDKSSNKYTYTINSLYLGKKFSPQLFTFSKDKFKGYEIVDLR
ncbi:LolA family protein [Sphingobacterium litopenaei]|uniref:Outer membrane lipoprotein carrier protein LolA n=1 Tax=Sphingobacterium litopenaei TaxID=2763500 RepID=A0ABR7YCE3_9SPHI|nr:outer membrane lipoprotein carrier protein LolA [Sphingobacterium litopenaei]MBD1428985.1 outer membrane lipoprotein carrier protein LolA [Sphingobacterium litopenaei]